MAAINDRQFVQMVKRESVDSTVEIMIKRLKSPRTPQPIPADQDEQSAAALAGRSFNEGKLKEQQQASWSAGLGDEGQSILRSLLEECAELSTLGFLTLIDGVGGPWEGIFEIVAVSAKEGRTVINPQNTEMLHDIFSDVCEEDRRHR